MVRKLVAALAVVSSIACATMDHGRMQQIQVDSDPPGATVTLSHCGAAGSQSAVTPTTVTVSRRATGCQVTLTTADRDTRTVVLHRHLSRDLHNYLRLPLDLCGDSLEACETADELAAGMFIWGVVASVGITVDASTGAIFEELPRAVAVDFESPEKSDSTIEHR